jgi:hypothetical protein
MKKSFISCFVVPVGAIVLFASSGCATQQQDCGTGGGTASSGAVGQAPECGNGVLEPGEQCDGMVPSWAPNGKICTKQCVLVTELTPLINEIYYPSGTIMGCFFEIVGSPGYDLTGFNVESVSATTGTTSLIASLKGLTIGDAGYFLVVQDNTVLIPSGVNSLLSPATHFTDGPGNVQLSQDGAKVDGLGWGDFSLGGMFVGEGQPALNPNAGSSICRIPNGADSNNNSADFKSCKATPGNINFTM